MRWRRGTGGRIEDRRGRGMPGGRIGAGVGGLGLVGVIVVILYGVLGGGGSGFDIDPSLDPFPRAPGGRRRQLLARVGNPEGDLRDLVVNDVQSSWSEAFAAAGR